MSGLLLTREERERFAAWCEREAESANGIIGEMEKMKNMPRVLVEREKMEAAAALIIAKKLRSIEDG